MGIPGMAGIRRVGVAAAGWNHTLPVARLRALGNRSAGCNRANHPWLVLCVRGAGGQAGDQTVRIYYSAIFAIIRSCKRPA